MDKQYLATKIWEMANGLRGKIAAAEYKDFILGFIFYKFLSEREEAFFHEEAGFDDLTVLTENNHDASGFARENIGYYIIHDDLFSTWEALGQDFNVGSVTEALKRFSRMIGEGHRKVFEGIFDSLDLGLIKLGTTDAERTATLSQLLTIIREIPMNKRQDYDVLGFVYEYLIKQFAANAGKGGEFYTPYEVSKLMSEIVAHHLRERDAIRICDPTSGSASLLLNIGSAVARHFGRKGIIKYYAKELVKSTYDLTRMNLVMRGINPGNIEVCNGDTLKDDWPEEEIDGNVISSSYLDAVVSNPPYSQPWNPTDRESDPRFTGYGLAPSSKADLAFLLHDLYHINQNGIATVVMPHGVLFRGGSEGEIRKQLVERNNIDAIIGLPPNIFFGTGIPTIIVVLKKNKPDTDVLIVDASKGFEKDGNKNRLRASDTKKIADAVIGRLTIPKFSRLVTREQIVENEYNLNIPRYVDSAPDPEKWDLYATMCGGVPISEIDALGDWWRELPNLRGELFADDPSGAPYAMPREGDARDICKASADVKAFSRKCHEALVGFDEGLERLIDDRNTLNVGKAEASISSDIFRRLEPVALVDKYDAYQLFSDRWSVIASDLGIIQSDAERGIDSIRQVDDRLVLKKKGGKGADKNTVREVADGLVGRIAPFELVERMYFEDDFNSLADKVNKASALASTYGSILEGFSEEEMLEMFALLRGENDAEDSEDGDESEIKVKPADVKKCVPKLYSPDGSVKGRRLTAIIENPASRERFEPESWQRRAIEAYDAIKEEAALKREIKALAKKLEDEAVAKIRSLTDEEEREVLREKWIKPICESLGAIPERLVSTLVGRVKHLAEKYAEPLHKVESSLSETGAALGSLLDGLAGDDFDLKGVAELRGLLGGMKQRKDFR